MPVKTDNGKYKCVICGKKGEYLRDVKKHESTCGVSSINQFLKNTSNLSFENLEFDKPETKQLKLDQRPKGKCANCGNPLTSRDVYNKKRDIYECGKCENLVRIEK